MRDRRDSPSYDGGTIYLTPQFSTIRSNPSKSHEYSTQGSKDFLFDQFTCEGVCFVVSAISALA
jgi:hypothetical protein